MHAQYASGTMFEIVVNAPDAENFRRMVEVS